jgi:hypothetical protein
MAWRAAIGERSSEVSVIPLGVSQLGALIEALAFTQPASPAPSPALPCRGERTASADGRHHRRPARRRACRTEALIVVAQELAAAGSAACSIASMSSSCRAPIPMAPRRSLRRRRRHRPQPRPPAAADAKRAIADLLATFAPLVVLDLHEYLVGGAFTTSSAAQRFDACSSTRPRPTGAVRSKAAEEWFRQPPSPICAAPA